NIIWGNTQASGKQTGQASALVEAQYNCIQDGFPGVGNITSDPLLTDSLCFQLSPGSPCTDAGSPAEADEDFSWNGKNAAFPARGGLRNDIGAYGGPSRGLLTCSQPFAAQGHFTKVTNSPVVTTPGDSRSVNWIDVDGDQDLDLMITNGPEAGENNFLYKNGGQGQFSLVTGDPIVQDHTPSDGATWADFDNDGDNDCFVANWWGVNNLFYKNNGNGTFQQVTAGNLVNDLGYSETASWGDYDHDGLVDLYVNNSGGIKKNFLYHNLGNGSFEKITTGSPVTDALASRCVNWTDYDNDGDLDIFVTNENDQNENLHQNNAGQFTKITTGPLLNDAGKTMSASWGDYDNDGDQDVFLANDQANNALFRNEGGGNFTKITTGPVVSSGGNSFGSEWADVDNDGDLDLFVTNAFNGGPWHNFLFRNQGNGVFERDLNEVIVTDQGWSYGAAFGDFDRDGDLDLAVANCLNATQPDYLYENHAAETTNHWLVVTCVGTTSNRSAIGAKVRVTANIGGQNVTQTREISAQSGYCGQNQLAPHFGLGNAAIVESMLVQWPSGLEELFGNLGVDQYVTVTEGQGISSVSSPQVPPGWILFPPSPNPFHDSVDCRLDLPEATTLRVEVVDLQGKIMRRLAEGSFEAGKHNFHWDGKTADGKSVPVGQYVLIFHQGSEVAARVLVKMH
ncbi:MAG: FG-GAP-like repeat-containing protein, partial [Saprospiraceae bacterium]